MSNNKARYGRPCVMNFITFITFFFIYYTLTCAIFSLAFLKKVTGRIFFCNCLALFAVMAAAYLAEKGVLFYGFPDLMFIAGAALFPLCFSLWIKNHLWLRNRWFTVLFAVLATGSFIISLTTPDIAFRILAFLLIAYSAAAVILLSRNRFRSGTVYLVMVKAHIACAVFSGIGFSTNTRPWLLAGMGSLFLIMSVLYTVNYYRQVAILTRHLQFAKQLNREMIHTVSRLKQKSEQLKKVINEKDLELLQMSKHASLAEITTGIAHELTQPLTGIKGIAQNMIDDINLDEFDKLQAAAELLRISSLVDKSSSIIDHIRNFSKKGFVNMQSIDMNRVVLDAIDLINLQFRKQNIDIILVLNEEIPRIHGDKIGLEQLFINFLLNARDAILEKRKTESDDYSGTITIISENSEAGVRLIIKDNGIGIPQENMKKIWSPFFTTKHRSKSTGVGLSISIKILKEHKAGIIVESEHGRGTTFTMNFPARKDAPTTAAL